MITDAYLVIVTWPDGSQGLLFPRPGNVPIATTMEQGRRDLDTAREHMLAFAKTATARQLREKVLGAALTLVHFSDGTPISQCGF